LKGEKLKSVTPQIAPSNEQEVRHYLARLLASPQFSSSPRLREFLTYLVDEFFAARPENLKESLIGVNVFQRPVGYDTRTDAIVRVEARRLRLKLQEYYDGPGAGDEVRITLAKGTYVPEFIKNSPRIDPEPAPPPASAETLLPPKHRPRNVYAVAGLVVVVLLLVGSVTWKMRIPPAQETSPPRPFTSMPGVEATPSFSPDGERVAYIADGEQGVPDVYIQRIDQDGATPLTRTPEAELGTAWSPDGSQIAFHRLRSDGRMDLITKPVTGGPEHIWGDVAASGGSNATLDWSPDGRYIVSSDREFKQTTTRIVRFWLEDGKREWITAPPVGSLGDRSPAISPDGTALAFRRTLSDEIEDLYMVTLSDRSMLDAQPKRLTNVNRGLRGHDWLPDGRSLVVSMPRSGNPLQLWRVPIDGSSPERIPDTGGRPAQPAISRKGNRLVWSAVGEDMNLWRLPLTGGAADPQPFNQSPMLDMAPQYSPDGSRVVFRSSRSGISALWVCDRDGANSRRLVDFGGAQVSAPRWSPDGQQIVFESRASGSSDLYTISAYGGKPKLLTGDSSNEILPWWSRDKQTIYYSSDRVEGHQVWKMPAAGGTPVRLTNAGGFAPA
jgi:Tol biopolymer transport system component